MILICHAIAKMLSRTGFILDGAFCRAVKKAQAVYPLALLICLRILVKRTDFPDFMRLFMCNGSKNGFSVRDSFKRLFLLCGKGKKTDKAQIFLRFFFYRCPCAEFGMILLCE